MLLEAVELEHLLPDAENERDLLLAKAAPWPLPGTNLCANRFSLDLANFSCHFGSIQNLKLRHVTVKLSSDVAAGPLDVFIGSARLPIPSELVASSHNDEESKDCCDDE